jgi:hypothetical protein
MSQLNIDHNDELREAKFSQLVLHPYMSELFDDLRLRDEEA